MKNNWGLILIVVVVVALIAYWFLAPESSPESDLSLTNEVATTSDKSPNNVINNQIKNMSHTITLKTNAGEIHFTTYDADAPKTVTNFITLARQGFYNGLIFHRVIDGFMIQGGDPTGTGLGGPGYTFADELNPLTDSYRQGYVAGVVAMANAGPNTNGSQFFIMVADTPLPNDYTIFGKVTAGLEIAQNISKTKTNANDRPLEDIVIEEVIVVEN